MAAIKGRFHALLQEAKKESKDYVLTDEITIPFPSTDAFAQLMKLLADQNFDEYEKVLFGDSYDAVKELFADVPYRAWEMFSKEVSEQFFGRNSGDVPGGSSAS